MVEAAEMEKTLAKYARVIVVNLTKDRILETSLSLQKYFIPIEEEGVEECLYFSSIEYETDKLLRYQEEHQHICNIFFNYILRLHGLINSIPNTDKAENIKKKIMWKAGEVKRVMHSNAATLNNVLKGNPIESAAFGVNEVFNSIDKILAHLPQ